jgi:PAS domain S-box-containing protein
MIISFFISRKAELALRQSEQHFRSLLENVPGAVYEYIYRKDGNMGFKWLSPSIKKMFGISPEIFMKSLDFIHPDDKWMVLENDKKYKTGQLESHSLVYRIYHSIGSIKWVLERGVVVKRTENGLPARIFGTLTDITKEKELQERLLSLQREKKKEIMQAVIEAQERESEEIACELNENINQTLSYCYLKLNAVLDDNIVYKEVLGNVMENINQYINEVRNIWYGLNNSTLHLVGLHETVNDLVSRVNKPGKIEIGINTNDSELVNKIDHKVSLTLFRIIQDQLLF